MRRIVTLTTDFGTADEFVGVMKGVIISRAPDVQIIDLTHEIPPQDLLRAGYTILASHMYFPPGTIHVVVVDPGVGSSRRIIMVETANQLFLAPDNGVLTPLLASEIHINAYELSAQGLFLRPVSNTFHGRDIFAPVTAALASGDMPYTLGRHIPAQDLQRLAMPRCSFDAETATVEGQVVFLDRFGNAMTSIHRDFIKKQLPFPLEQLIFEVNGRVVGPLQSSYSSAEPGQALAIIGSRGFVEISVNGGNAVRLLDIKQNDAVKGMKP